MILITEHNYEHLCFSFVSYNTKMTKEIYILYMRNLSSEGRHDYTSDEGENRHMARSLGFKSSGIFTLPWVKFFFPLLLFLHTKCTTKYLSLF